MISRLLIFVVTTALTAGCSPSTTIEDFADDAKEAKASAYIQQLIEGDFEEIKNSFDPKLKPQVTDDLLNQMKDRIGKGEPLEINLIGYNAHTFNREPTRYNLSYQYGFKDRWILVNVAFRTSENGRDEIFGLNVYNPMDRPLQEIHKFTFRGKGTIHYIFMAGCALVPLLILSTLVAAIRTKITKRKWMWIVFILIGIGQFSLNWTTGKVGFKPLSFQLLGSGVQSASIYAPWFLNFSLPIGALIFWFKRENLRQKNVQQDASANTDEPGI